MRGATQQSSTDDHAAGRTRAQHPPLGGPHTNTTCPTVGGGRAPTQHALPWRGPHTNVANPTKRGATHQHTTNPGQPNTQPQLDPGTTNQHRNKQDNYMNNIRPRKRPQQRQGTNAKQANHEAANTTVHQQNHCSGHDMTINRPHASRPTLNQPGMQGSKQEWRPTGWRHRRAPRPPTTIPTNTTEHVTLPLRTRPTDVNKLHYTTLGQPKRQLTSTDTDVPATQTTFGDTTTGSSATEPTQTKPTMRRPRQPRTNHTAAAAAS